MILVDDVKDAITVSMLLNAYGVKVRGGRCACPIHHGKDLNMVVKARWYRCYVCESSGTVIDLHMAMTGQNLSQCLIDLNAMFGLGLDERDPRKQYDARFRVDDKRAAARDAEKIEQHNFEVIDQLAAIRQEMWKNGSDFIEIDNLLDECDRIAMEGGQELPPVEKLWKGGKTWKEQTD